MTGLNNASKINLTAASNPKPEAATVYSAMARKKQLANFRVDHREDFFESKDRPPLVIPGQSSISPLIAIVSGAKKDMPMADFHKLSGQDVELLKVWIDSGAEWTITTDNKK
jgi:hypothetical protein